MRPAPDPFSAESAERPASSEIASLHESLTALRAVIGSLGSHQMGAVRLPAVLAEIGALRREAEAGVEKILTSAEAILAAPVPVPPEVQGHAIAILEACGFHDLIGQRLSKVSDLLQTLEVRLNRVATSAGVVDTPVAETETERLYREQTINGPALNGPDVTQSQIDALFG
ncbi:hypothetical protein [Caulobacter henricii]|uniref:Chemotaxis protein CheZ n=1 Tax=Caulobacter henricii TaxID=69395 RepID=A0A0P0P0R7_9CAUL|nr:hypothetical protein [Caulobacter henricii]ALL14112.1 hypothetical protein AQ619_12610 [Caulobacter henricii]